MPPSVITPSTSLRMSSILRQVSVNDMTDALRRPFAGKNSHASLRRLRRLRRRGRLSTASAFSPSTSVTSTSPTGRPLRSTTGSSLNFRVASRLTASPTRVPLRDRRRAGDHHLGDRPIEGRFVAPLEQAGQVAVGEQTR